MNHDERSTAGVPVRDLIELATRAPSVHNTQPWHWCVIGEGVALSSTPRASSITPTPRAGT